jgi:putative ABC transport system permease protein
MVGFTAMMLLASLILLSLLFSAVISERQRELGLLRAIGTRRLNIVQMLLSEASFATGFGGICGIALGCCLLLVFQHSLIYFLETMHVEFAWPLLPEIVTAGSVCVLLAVFVGLLGAALPAWLATGKEAYSLIQCEDD